LSIHQLFKIDLTHTKLASNVANTLSDHKFSELEFVSLPDRRCEGI